MIGGDIETWSRFLAALDKSKWEAEFYVIQNGNRISAWGFPVADIFAGLAASSLSTELVVRAGRIWLSGHLSTVDEIEFCFDPADSELPEDREAVLDFARWMSSVCGLRVVITDEAANHSAVPWLYTNM
ncbi:hypothetical protein [Micromonospora sp. LOL_023]|uniref:hypothetical protein n=1 Tax=Micromonospora sp. LOL_023 TaxID=3345418 RepID=UPI003A8B397B